jgi:1-acyl-sn-glycerol-3-phosphate acyltransferase
MSRLRALARLSALGVWTALVYAARLACLPLAPFAPAAEERARRALYAGWARGSARLLGMRVEVSGDPPAPPFLLCANHLSYVDVIALGGLVEGVFLAKAEVARWPLIGFVARTSGTLFLERGRRQDLVRALAAVERTLGKGTGVVFFPEGTSSDGAEVLPFKSSLFEAARASGLPVHCAAVEYETPPGAPPARLAVSWWGGMTFPGHLWRLASLPGFRARVGFAAEPVPATLERRTLAAEARERVAALRPLIA